MTATTLTKSPSEIASEERAHKRRELQEAKNASKAKPKAKAAPKKTEADTKKPAQAPALVSASNSQPATLAIAQELQQAFDFFNREFFEGRLPHCVLTLTRLRKYAGQFAPKRWLSRSAKAKAADCHEIQIDAVVMRERGDKRALSTLLHEMIHLAVEHSGKGPKRAYHCKIWAGIMKEMGLQPVAIVKGQPVPGKETGANCTHEIIKGGPFDKSADELLATGFQFSWGAVAEPEKEKGKKKSKAGAKVAHECPKCGDKAWGKSSLKLVCGNDGAKMVCEEAEGHDDDEDDE